MKLAGVFVVRTLARQRGRNVRPAALLGENLSRVTALYQVKHSLRITPMSKPLNFFLKIFCYSMPKLASSTPSHRPAISSLPHRPCKYPLREHWGTRVVRGVSVRTLS